ncbi:MAG: DNA cytosine methyltransferase [Vicinamibacterales bacterium]
MSTSLVPYAGVQRAAPVGSAAVYFAGGCGDITALEAAGIEPVAAANHWTKAMDVCKTNFLNGDYPSMKYALGDIAAMRPENFGALDVDFLVGGSECDGHSMASSLKQAQEQLRPYLGPDDPRNGLARSRATAWCFMLFALVHRPRYVLIENVLGFFRWSVLKAWMAEWEKIGYSLTWNCSNAAVYGVPQSRERVIFCAVRRGEPVPNFKLTPDTWCWDCQQTVPGIRVWKPVALKRQRELGMPAPWGSYGLGRGAYYYACPHCAQPTSLWASPVASVLDWSDRGQRIGDRAEPLAHKTVARIMRGLDKYGWLDGRPMSIVNPFAYASDKGKMPRPAWLPNFAHTARQDFGMVIPPGFQIDLRQHNQPRRLDETASTVCATGNHQALVTAPADGLVVSAVGNTYEREHADGTQYVRAWASAQPSGVINATNERALVTGPWMAGDGFAVANFGGHGNGHMRDVVLEPAGTLTAGGQTALLRTPEAIISSYYGGGDVVRHSSDPAATATGHDRHALITRAEGTFLARAGGTRQADVVAGIDPAPTRMPNDSYGVVQGAIDVQDCHFRMFKPEESQAIQDVHVRTIPLADGRTLIKPVDFSGSNGDNAARDRTALAGNAVPRRLMQHHIERCRDAAALAA